MISLKVAAAQIVSKRENIPSNIETHVQYIKKAEANGVQLISFPEMSLTGYERALAQKQAFSVNDKRLEPLKKISTEKNIIIVAGAPIAINNSLYIGSFIIYPDQKIDIYTKQFLHSGEEEFFASSFDFNPQINIGDETISLAICADITNPIHPENACKAGASIYIPGIFYTPNGIGEAYHDLSLYAKKYKFHVLMSNFTGYSWDMESAGESAFWLNNGQLLGKLEKEEGILIAEKEKNKWICKTIY